LSRDLVTIARADWTWTINTINEEVSSLKIFIYEFIFELLINYSIQGVESCTHRHCVDKLIRCFLLDPDNTMHFCQKMTALEADIRDGLLLGFVRIVAELSRPGPSCKRPMANSGSPSSSSPTPPQLPIAIKRRRKLDIVIVLLA
jgi:hypothetical protein